MQWTNLNSLPAPLVSAIRNDLYDRVGDISITGLLKPPRMRQLERRYDEWIVEDVSEGIWRLLGSIGHAIIERADQDNHLAEERLTMPVLGWTVSGKADLLAPDMTISDYKFTSAFSFMFGEKPEWVAQLNMYAELYEHYGFEAKALQIVAVLRDWQKSRARRERESYPQQGVIVQPIELWPKEKRRAFLEERVRLHQEAEKLADADLPMCTDEERWKRADSWAVKRKGNKRAVKLFDTECDAVEMLRSFNSDLIVEHRPGSYVRCQLFCSARQFCSFGKTLTTTAEEAA